MLQAFFGENMCALMSLTHVSTDFRMLSRSMPLLLLPEEMVVRGAAKQAGAL